MADEGAGRRPRVMLLDPNSHTLPYDRALAGALAEAGWAVELVAAPFLYEALPPPTDYRWSPRFFRALAGPLAHRLGLAGRPRLRRLLKAAAYPLDWAALLADLARRPPAVLHVQWSLWPALDGRLWAWCRRRGVPVVYTAHNLLPHAADAADADRYRHLYHAADAVIVHSAASAAILADRFGLPADRVYVAPHGPLLAEEPVLPRPAARARLGLPPDAPLLLFAGLIEPYKGLDDLIAAFIRLAPAHPTAHLVIAGRPNAPLAGPLAALAAAGLGGRVRVDARFVPQADLAAYLCAADAVALPYRAATSSGLLLAARRFACPVVATAVGDLATLVEDGHSGLLVPPGDPAALATALGRLLADPTLARRLGLAGQQAALVRDAWPVAAARTLAVYAAVRAERVGHRAQ